MLCESLTTPRIVTASSKEGGIQHIKDYFTSKLFLKLINRPEIKKVTLIMNDYDIWFKGEVFYQFLRIDVVIFFTVIVKVVFFSKAFGNFLKIKMFKISSGLNKEEIRIAIGNDS